MSDSPQDAAADAAQDTTQDAEMDSPMSACDPDAAFGAPSMIGGGVLGNSHLSTDELTLYFEYAESGTQTHIYQVTRGSIDGEFALANRVLAAATSAMDRMPAVTADGLSLFFHQTNGNTNAAYVATRASITATFGTPQAVPGLTGVYDLYPTANFLYFGAGTADLYVAPRLDSAVGTSMPIAELNSPAIESDAVVSQDARVIYFGSNRNDTGAHDVWRASRASTSVAFGDIEPIASVNTTAPDRPFFASADDCRLYVIRPDGLWVASRPER